MRRAALFLAALVLALVFTASGCDPGASLVDAGTDAPAADAGTDAPTSGDASTD